MLHPFNRKDVCVAFKGIGLQKLYFFSYLNNAGTIADYGLLSLSSLRQSGLNFQSFAEETVQYRRDNRFVETSAGKTRNVHEMVPFYFTTKTPTLFARRECQSDLIFWILPIDHINDPNVEFAFSDGNLGSHNSGSYFHQFDVTKVPIDVISSEYWTNFEDGRRRRNAEMLIFGNVPIDCFEGVICISDDTKWRFQKTTQGRSFSRNVTVNPLAFF